MASEFDGLPQVTFAGTPMLVTRMSIKGGMRNHLHEYPHVPGGNNERMGRKPYTISIDCVFVTGVDEYEGLWPDGLRTLRETCEAEVVDDLVLPTIGTIQAHATDWEQELSNKIRNGETAHFEFIEDSTEEALSQTVLSVTYTNVSGAYGALVLVANDNGFSLDIFGQIAALVAELQAYRDQVDLYADRIAAKAEQLAQALRDLDELDDFDDAALWEVVAAMQSLGVAADNLARDALAKLAPLATYTVPIEMSVSEVSTRIYGDTSHAVELMNLNGLDDALAIPGGTDLIYYAIPTPFGAIAA